MKTFKAADGRRVPWTNERQIEEGEKVTLLSIITPLIIVPLFGYIWWVVIP